jgi:hypothetical protein
MSLATERLIVPISPADKKRIEAKAARLGRNMTAEFVRRAALAYDPDEAEDEAELRALLASFEQVHKDTLAQLDRTDKALDTALAHFERRSK